MSRGSQKYQIPKHLSRLGVSQDDFGQWLDRATAAHVRRDRKRTKAIIRPMVYRLAIFKAVSEGGNRDYYTGEPLNWRLLRHFSKNNGLDRDERLMPSIDHEGLNTKSPTFRICSLRTNKCKSNYSIKQMFEFCKAFIKHQKRKT